MKKNPEVTAITRKNFIEAYCQLSQKIPLEKITVRAVTECAGYNRSTFYQYFDDINDVVTAIESEVLAHVLVKVDDNLLRGQLTLGFIEAFSHLHAELSNYYQVVFLPTVNSSFTNKLKTAVMEKSSKLTIYLRLT
ncbi:TetR/AcrR family transcriptional regulator [Lactiplantibacillus plantarum]|nr:TetR/AcrR family transcriptional regulator [Lactiplantibacillus plantarum]